jgi:hypothetical protein
MFTLREHEMGEVEKLPGVFFDSYVAKENQVVRRTNSHHGRDGSVPVILLSGDGHVVSM